MTLSEDSTFASERSPLGMEKKLVVNTTQKEIQLCFEKSEFEMVCQALKEAAIMLEVNQILYSEK